MYVKRSALMLLIAGSVVGCAGQQTQQRSFDEGFGQSVRAMIEAQTYRSDDQVPALRGDKAAEAMRKYRRGQTGHERSELDMLRLPGSRSSDGGGRL